MEFGTFFLRLLNMSLTAGITIVCVLLLRLFLKKAPKIISYCLWAVVLFRLLCPVSIESGVSLFGLLGTPTTNVTTKTSSIEYVPRNITYPEFSEVTIPDVSETIHNTLPQERKQPTNDPAGILVSFEILGAYVWLFGFFWMALYSMVSYVRLRRKLLTASLLQKNIYLVDEIETPFVMGLIRPKIYIPSNMTEKQLPYIILHEHHHIRRGDHIIKALAFLALSIHWFNPLVWVAFVCANKDMEMSCDEAVVKNMGDDILADYTASLLSLATGRTIIAGMPLAFGEGDTKGRIRNLANWRKPTFWLVLLAVIACGLLGISLFTNPERNDVGDITTEENMPVAFSANEDGSYRLSEYRVDLTGDKIKERIVFDVYYWADLEAKAETITEELLWEELWNGCEVRAKVLTEDNKVLWEHSYSDAHPGNGNLAVVRFRGQNCLMRYHNMVYQGNAQLFYEIEQLQELGAEPVILEKGEAIYNIRFGYHEESVIAKVLEVAEELDGYLMASGTHILVNATLDKDNCYLYGSDRGLSYGVRHQTAFDIFKQEVGGNGWELNLQDYFYPNGMESITVLPEDAEAHIRAGKVLCMEVSPDNPTAGRLDLDGDGVREVLYLYGISDWTAQTGWRSWTGGAGSDVIKRSYCIRVNEHHYETYCDNLDPILMTFSPDGEQIFIAVYDDGPSGDPLTTFYRYDDTGVYPAGSIPNDLRRVSIDENGLIYCTFRADKMQTEWAWGYYYWNGNEMVQREDEIYYYYDDSKWRKEEQIPLVLLRDITVFSERSESSEPIVLKAQEVRNVATDNKEWILLEGKDGTKGWIRTEGFYFPTEEADPFELFDGLNNVD